jgi:hypothetical protein
VIRSDAGPRAEGREQRTEGSWQLAAGRGKRKGDRSQRKDERDSPVGAAFPDLPVPGVVPGSLSKVSRDLALYK